MALTGPRSRRLAAGAVLAGAAVAAVAAAAELAEARPGGGEGYSGGGGHSRGGGGGDGDAAVIFELVYWLFRLVFAYPAVGLPLLAVVIGYVVISAYRQQRNRSWDSGPPVPLERRIALDEVRRVDPAFSPIVFEDFAFRLFAAAHRARHSPEALAAVAPYVGEAARAELAGRAPAGEPVAQVIVGALRTYRVELGAARVRIGIEVEANLATAAHTCFTVERWLLGRDAAARSKPPGGARIASCPSCGAPWQASDTGTQVCASCGQAVDNGRFDWVVERAALVSSDERPPTLTAEVPERGTELPTYRQPDLDAAWAELTRADPAVTEAALAARLAMIYDQLNTAWAGDDLRPARGLITDGLYDYLSYWLEAYRRQGLRNVLSGMRITRTAMARVSRDAYYDAVTVRIWGTGRDHVVRRSDGAHVRGSRRRDRAYSEYWTLIRSAARTGAPAPAPTCGNCGAPLRVGQAGACEHCGAHVTAGEFDWVVSKIEQDDSYRG